MVLAAGCGGGGGGSHAALPSVLMPSGTSTSAPAAAVRVPSTVSLVIPKSRAAQNRNPKYVSSATAGIAISVYPRSQGMTAPSPQFVSSIVGSQYCTAQPNGDQLCGFPISAPVGSDYADVTLYDAAPLNGVPQGNKLSHTSAPVTIANNATNALGIKLGGDVAYLQFGATQWVTAQGAGGTLTVNVTAYDASGNVIVGTDLYDNGPFTLGFTGDGVGHLTFGKATTASIASPADATLTITWDGTTFSTSGPNATGLTGSVGANPFNLILPTPKQAISVPVTVPGAQWGDLALALPIDSGYSNYSEVSFLPAGSTSGFENALTLLAGTWNLINVGALSVAALPDGATAAAYVASVYYNGLSVNDVEIDVTKPDLGGSPFRYSDAAGPTSRFFTDLCQLTGFTGDPSGHISVAGFSSASCGLPNGTPLPLYARRAPAARARAASGNRHVSAIASPPQDATWKIETFGSPELAPLASVAADHTIQATSGALINSATGITSDASGNVYLAATGSPAGQLVVWAPTSTSGDSPDGSVPLSAQPVAVATNALGKVAVLESNDTVSYQVEVFSGGTVLQTVGHFPVSVASNAPYAPSIAFDRFGNLWVAAGSTAVAYPPIPIGTLYSAPSSLATVSLSFGSSISGIAGMPAPIATPTPTPTPMPSSSSLPSPLPTFLP